MTLWTVAHQAPLSMQFSRQEYWSGVPCPPPGVLLNSGKELTFLTSPTLAGGFFTTSTTWKAHIPYVSIFSKVFILNACRIFFYMLKKWRCGVWEHPLCRLLALILISALKPLPALSSSLWEKPFQNINWIMSFSLLEVFQWALTNC